MNCYSLQFSRLYRRERKAWNGGCNELSTSLEQEKHTLCRRRAQAQSSASPPKGSRRAGAGQGLLLLVTLGAADC